MKKFIEKVETHRMKYKNMQWKMQKEKNSILLCNFYQRNRFSGVLLCKGKKINRNCHNCIGAIQRISLLYIVCMYVLCSLFVYLFVCTSLCIFEEIKFMYELFVSNVLHILKPFSLYVVGTYTTIHSREREMCIWMIFVVVIVIV